MEYKALAKLASLLIKRNQQNNQSQIKVGGMESDFFVFLWSVSSSRDLKVDFASKCLIKVWLTWD